MNSRIQSTDLSRHDLKLISEWIEPKAKVMDLGCGDGRLLSHLKETKQISGYGIELDPARVVECVQNGVNVIQTNLDKGLGHFDDGSFDVVVLSLTLQAMRDPKALLNEMLRVGNQGIVTFPNFAYWRNRLQFARGKMPVSDELPYKWYDTPNIHLCTIQDFHELCNEMGFVVQDSIAANISKKQGLGLKIWPNFFGEIALCRFQKASH